jgi:N-acetylglucosaminyl-diphospho-decaprenol L-rhamnosyltransferase
VSGNGPSADHPGGVPLSVVIVSYNTRPLLEACLSSLRSSGIEAEIIVVDNASTDDSAEAVRERFSEVRLIRSETNRGFAGGNNLAFPYCRGRYVALLNADTEVEPGGFAEMVNFLEAHPQVGAVGPRLLNPDGTVQPSAHRFPRLGQSAVRLFLRLPQPASPPSSIGCLPGAERASPSEACELHDWLTGACLMVRRAVLEQVGSLDEQFFFECEDVDWCRRIRAAGWEIGLLPVARVTHKGGGSGIGFSPNALRGHAGHCYYYRKYHGRRAETVMRALFLLYHLLGWLKYSARFGLRRAPGDRVKQQVHRLGILYFVGNRARWGPRARHGSEGAGEVPGAMLGKEAFE